MIAALVGLSGLLWAGSLAATPGPLAPSSALAIAIGFVIFTVIAVAGLLLVRAPWSRWVGLGVASFGILIGARDIGPLGWLAVGASFAAIIGLTGPWLNVWLRKRPSATDIGWQPIVLVFASVGLTPLVGLASPSGLSISHGLLAGAGLFFGWAYARAEMWSLWGLRLIILPASLLTIPANSAGAVVLVLAAAGITALAWTRQARKALGGPSPVLPAPRPPRKERK